MRLRSLLLLLTLLPRRVIIQDLHEGLVPLDDLPLDARRVS